MNPLTNVKNITKLNETELARGTKKSWHDMYSDSAWVFIGGLSYGLTEGDVLSVFSQFGEIVNLNMVRDKETGKIKGFAFICYANQKSTVLAVDNLNGIKLCGRTIRVDHVANYRIPKEHENDDDITKSLHAEGCAPKPFEPEAADDDIEILPPQKKEDKKKKLKVHTLSSENDGSSRKKLSKEVKVKVEEPDTGYDKYAASSSKSNHEVIPDRKRNSRWVNDDDSDEPTVDSRQNRHERNPSCKKSKHSHSPNRQNLREGKRKHKKKHRNAEDMNSKDGDSAVNHKYSYNDRQSSSNNDDGYKNSKHKAGATKDKDKKSHKRKRHHESESSNEADDSEFNHSHKHSSKKKHINEYKNSKVKHKTVDQDSNHPSSSRHVPSKRRSSPSSGTEGSHSRERHNHRHFDDKKNDQRKISSKKLEHHKKYKKSHRSQKDSHKRHDAHGDSSDSS